MSNSLRVLMVEDSEDSCLLIASELEKHGYTPNCRRVSDSDTMRKALASETWDVIIADFMVPGFGALESLALARTDAPDLPFIVVSGNVGEDSAVAVMKAGAHDYITKANLARLVPAIERELRDREMRLARQQAENALHQKEALSRAVLDSLPAEIAVLDREGTILATNAAWDWAQASPGPTDRNYLEIFRRTTSGGNQEKVISGIRAVLAGTAAHFSFEYARQVQTGNRWCLLHATPLINAGGAVVSQIDITETRRAEEALRHSEARFRDVVESLGEGLLLSGPDDVIWYANSRMGQLTGCDPSEMIEQPASAYFRPSLSSPREAEIPGYPPPTEPERAEVELVQTDGTTIWTEVNAVPLRDSQGRAIGTVRAITDITERRQAREALRKSQASLILAQRIGHVGSWELDLAERTMEWSSETRRILDLLEGTTPATFDRFLEGFHREDILNVREAFEHAITNATSFRADCRLPRPDGSVSYLHLQGQVILDSEETAAQMIGTVQDITERKLLEEQLRHSQKMEAVGQLAGGIAHDFNNILTVIQGYTELIGYQDGIDAQTRVYASQIGVSAERASKLTRQLLAFSRKQVMQLKTLHLNEMLNNNLSSMLQRLLGEQSKLQLNLEADLPTVVADAGMLEQVLINLVVNARDAMPKGGRLIIETSSHQVDPDYCQIHPEAVPGRFACLGVIDTGCGMDPDTLSRIFEPFFTTKEVGRGTGLGLSSVYGIVKQHQGWLQVASELGRGSAFKVFLPVSDPGATPASNKTRIIAPAAGSETILLVEDEPPLRQLAQGVLERFGYRVLEAGSGPEAITIWKEVNGEVDLLLTDMVMPGGMTGRELAVLLQSQKRLLKVLYTSGYSLDFVESDLLLREGINFVPKPYSGRSLTTAVRACLDRRT